MTRGYALSALVVVAAAIGCGKVARTDDAPSDGGASGAAGSEPSNAGSRSANGGTTAGTGGRPTVGVGEEWDHLCPADQSDELLCVPIPNECTIVGSYLVRGETCSVDADCNGRSVEASCSSSVSGVWSCTCPGQRGFIELTGVADDGSACHSALEFCPTDFLAGGECAAAEGGLANADECLEDFECKVSYELDSGLGVVASDLKTGLCENEDGEWVCYCEGVDSATFKILAPTRDPASNVCAQGADVCRAFSLRRPDSPTKLGLSRLPDGNADSCKVHSLKTSADSCSLIADCYFAAEAWGTVAVAPLFAQRVSCERDGDEWACDCDSQVGSSTGTMNEPTADAEPCLDHLVKECHGAWPAR